MDKKMRDVLSRAYGVGKYAKQNSEWSKEKEAMVRNIEEVKKNGTVDKETLELMIEMLDRTQLVSEKMVDSLEDNDYGEK